MPTDRLDERALEVQPEPSPVQGRLIDTHVRVMLEPEPNDRAYGHSWFCQASILPYRVGRDIRTWQRTQGRLTLQLQAGFAPSAPGSTVLEPVGLPSGPRARLVLIHLMTQAVLTQSPELDLGDSLTAFMRSLGIDTNGRNIKAMREQLRRLAACSLRVLVATPYETDVVQTHLIDRMQVFSPESRANERSGLRSCDSTTPSTNRFSSTQYLWIRAPCRPCGIAQALSIHTFGWLSGCVGSL